MAKKKVKYYIVAVSYNADIPVAHVKKELRCRVNESCTYVHDEECVKIKSVTPMKRGEMERAFKEKRNLQPFNPPLSEIPF